MATTQEIFELLYKSNPDAVEAMDRALADQAKALDLLAKETYELAHSDAELIRQIGAAEAAILKETPALTAFDRALDEAVQSTQRVNAVHRVLNESFEAIGPATDKAKTGTANLGRGVLSLSQGIEDLQYGVGAVLNNVPQAILMFGGSAGLAGAISLAAVAAKVLYDHWGELTNLFQTQNPIPKATDTLKRHEEALKKVNDELDHFKGRTSLSNTELLEYNRLTAEATRLEKQLAEQRETEANRKSHGALSNAAARERAGAFGEALDEFGGFDKLIEGIESRQNPNATPKQKEAFRTYLNNLINDALKGDQVAIREIGSVSQGLGIGFEGLLSATNPEARRKEAQFIERQQREAKEAREAKERNDRLVEQLNLQGQKNESVMRKELTDAQEKAAKKDQDDRAKTTRARGAAIGKGLDEQAGAIGKGGLQAQAEAMMAQLRAAGATEARAQMKVQAQLRDFLQRTGAVGGGLRPAIAAMNITNAANEGLDQKIVNLQGQGLNAQEANLQAVFQTQQAVATLIQRTGRAEATARQALRNAGQLRRAAQPGGQTALNQGGDS